MAFNTVVEYVKNLFPGRAPELELATQESDAEAIACLSLRRFYITAKNRKKYWYCVAFEQEINTILGLLRRNGVVAEKHKSHYDCIGGRWVVRVSKDFLDKNPSAQEFIDKTNNVVTMDVDNEWLAKYEAARQKQALETKSKQKTK